MADVGCLLHVRVQPRASRNEIRVSGDREVKVWLTAPPVEGKANRALLKLMAKALGVPASSLEITRGGHGRDKTLSVSGLSADEVMERLGAG